MTRKSFDLQKDTIFGAAGAATLDVLDNVAELNRNAIKVDPRTVHREGPYIRRWKEPEELEAFCSGVAAEGRIIIPIGIREVEREGGVRYVLVYGDRRLTAAERASFSEIPAVNHGAISEAEAVLLQALENEPRKNMHIVDSALAYYALTQNGLKQADVCRRFGRTDGYMSVMVRAGEGMAALTEEERSKLYRSGKATLATFQKLVYGRNRDEVIAGFTQLVNERSASKPVSRAEPFTSKEVGTGRRFSFKWTGTSLKRDPLGTTRALMSGLGQEIGRLQERVSQLDASTPGCNEAERLLARLQRALSESGNATAR